MSTPSNPGSLEYQLAGWSFHLKEDGSLQAWPLSMARADEVALAPVDMWALALFLRMPGVWALIKRCELERQHERHCQEALTVAE